MDLHFFVSDWVIIMDDSKKGVKVGVLLSA